MNALANDRPSDAQVFWIHADGRILDGSEPAAQALGYSREELRGLTVWDVDPAFPRAHWPEHWEELCRVGRLNFQTSHRHRDGSRLRVEVFAQVVELDGRHYNCALVYPLTPRRLAENALRESEERLALALAVSGQGLYDLDLISGTSVFSDAYARMLGYEPSELELTPTRWESWLHPEERAWVLQRYQDCLDGRQAEFAAEHRLRTRCGDWLWVHSHGQVVQRDALGRPLRLIGTQMDISGRIESERSLRDHGCFLENLDRISRILTGRVHDVGLITDLAREILDIFQVDRVFFLHPCDPEAPTFRIRIEVTRPAWPGLFADRDVGPDGVELVPDDAFRAHLRQALSHQGPLTIQFADASGSAAMARRYGLQSQLATVLYPQADQTWLLGLQQCAAPRHWTGAEQRLFQAIAERAGEALSGHLLLQQLQASERRYRAMFETAAVAIWEEDLAPGKAAVDALRAQGIRDVRGHLEQHPEVMADILRRSRTVDVNQQALKLFGATRKDEFLGSFDAIMPPEALPAVREILVGLAEGRHHVEMEMVNRTLRGERLDLLLSVALPEPNGPFTNLLASMVDITDRKRMERALRESETRLRTAIESIPFDVFLIDAEGRYALQNTASQRRWGNIIGRRPDQLDVDPDLLSHWESNHRRVAEGEIIDEEVRYIQAGEEQFLRNVIAPIKENGEVRGVVGLSIDITERKRTERALQLAHTAIDKSGAGFYWLSPKGQVIDANPAAADSLGYSREELTGLYIWDFDPNYGPEMADATWDQVRRQRSITFESSHRRKDGTIFPIEGTTNYVCMGSEEYAFTFVQDISDRKVAEAELRASEERFAKVFRASPAPTVISTLDDGRFIDANDRWLDAMGYRREEVIGRTSKDIDLWVDPKARARLISTLQAEGSMRDVPVRIRGKAGEERDQLWSAEILSLGGQAVLLSAVQDITERKRADQALRLAQISILRSADAVFWITPQGRFIHVNDQACESLGYTRDELLGMGVWDIDPDFSPQRWPDHWKRTRMLKKRRFETRHRRRDGSIFPVEVTANYVDYEGQEYDFAFVRDITERQCAEEALRASEHKFRAVVQNAQAITFILDRQGVFLLSEGQGLTRLGLAPGQVVGQSAFDLYQAYPSVVDNIRNALSGELTHVTNILGDAIFDVVYSPYYDRDGQQSGVIGIAIDISERKRAEEELRQHREHLEELVAERTAALQQAMTSWSRPRNWPPWATWSRAWPMNSTPRSATLAWSPAR